MTDSQIQTIADAIRDARSLLAPASESVICKVQDVMVQVLFEVLGKRFDPDGFNEACKPSRYESFTSKEGSV